MRILICLCAALAVFVGRASAAAPATEPDLAARRLWARDKAAATVVRDDQARHDGRATIRVDHTGAKDWSLEPAGKR
jgi:hypothetical protein